MISVLAVEDYLHDDREYDVALGALGYESRATYAMTSLEVRANKKAAIAFPRTSAFSFQDNEIQFVNMGFEIVHCSDPQCLGAVRHLLDPCGRAIFNVLVDISSFNRQRLAHIVQTLAEKAEHSQILIDFVYTVAATGVVQDHGPIRRIGPVTPFFAGWSSSADLPPAAVFGVGYEQEKAIGCLENLEPYASWAFRTRDDHSGNYQLVTEANELLWQTVPEERVVEYSLDDPLGTFLSLEAVVYGALQSFRPVLIPFGPKIFYLTNLLVATVHHPSVAVWRAELFKPETPQDRVPNRVVGLRVLLGVT